MVVGAPPDDFAQAMRDMQASREHVLAQAASHEPMATMAVSSRILQGSRLSRLQACKVSAPEVSSVTNVGLDDDQVAKP